MASLFPRVELQNKGNDFHMIGLEGVRLGLLDCKGGMTKMAIIRLDSGEEVAWPTDKVKVLDESSTDMESLKGTTWLYEGSRVVVNLVWAGRTAESTFVNIVYESSKEEKSLVPFTKLTPAPDASAPDASAPDASAPDAPSTALEVR